MEGNGGSGGRIVFNVNEETALMDGFAFAYGGVNPKYQQSQQFCLNGAPGSIYFTKSRTLQIKGFAQIKTPMKTPVITDKVDQLQNPILIDVSQNVNLAPYSYEQDGKNMSHLNAEEITIRDGAIISSPIT